jgi:hypothetical protein
MKEKGRAGCLRGFLEGVGLVGELPADVLVADLAESTCSARTTRTSPTAMLGEISAKPTFTAT